MTTLTEAAENLRRDAADAMARIAPPTAPELDALPPELDDRADNAALDALTTAVAAAGLACAWLA